MPNSPILEAETVDWTFEDVTEELEHLAVIEDLEPSNEPMPEPDQEWMAVDDEIERAAEELRTVALLEMR